MSSILLAFFTSFVGTLLIVRFQGIHEKFSCDWDTTGAQKFHTNIVPRIGGISIAISLISVSLFRVKSEPGVEIETLMLICSAPVFSIGLLEDLTKKISVRMRLAITAISAVLAIYILNIQITSLDIPFIDYIFSLPLVGSLLAVFAITGLANSYNIVDGFNGLASMVGIITLTAIAYVGLGVNDPLIIYLSLSMAASIFGFFVWNHPLGLIFLGDGGAYLIGFWIATLSVLLIHRHQEISPWFGLLINGYPVIETLFSIYRRKIHQNTAVGQPDGVHLHTLIYRRVLTPNFKKNLWANSMTSPYLWALTIAGVTPAIIWYRSTSKLAASCLVFFLFYVWLYKKIVNLKTPKWLFLN